MSKAYHSKAKVNIKHRMIYAAILINLLCGLVLVNTQSDFTCVNDGMFAYNACTQLVQCVFTNTPNAYKAVISCPTGTLFDNNLQVCNWPEQVVCDSNAATTTISNDELVTTPNDVKTTDANTVTTQASVVNSFSPTFQEFSDALTQNGYPAPTLVKYTNFVNGLSSQGGITTKREAAMFLAEIIHESGGLLLVIETACGIGCVSCPYDYLSPGFDSQGARYCGRGYIQLVIFHDLYICN